MPTVTILDDPMGFGDDMPEDEARVSALVAALNALPGVHSIRACAGHDEPIDSHRENDEFEVHFAADETAEAWASVTRIAHACEVIGPASASFDSDKGEYAFDVYGFIGLEPDDLARLIRADQWPRSIASH
jgi:hypothetical protein